MDPPLHYKERTKTKNVKHVFILPCGQSSNKASSCLFLIFLKKTAPVSHKDQIIELQT